MWHHVFASHEEKQETSLGQWPGDDFLGVALPDVSALRKTILIRYNGKQVLATVMDVGPWCIDDPYWLTNGLPRAQTYKGQACVRKLGSDGLATIPDATGGFSAAYKSNGAGIDLFPGTANALQIPIGENVWIDWSFA